jgi:hypothetical protein
MIKNQFFEQHKEITYWWCGWFVGCFAWDGLVDDMSR